MRTLHFSVLVCSYLLSAAPANSMALADDAPQAADGHKKQAPPPTAQELAELQRFIQKIEAERSVIDKIFASSKRKDAQLDALAVIFEKREYNSSKYAYSKLIDLPQAARVSRAKERLQMQRPGLLDHRQHFSGGKTSGTVRCLGNRIARSVAHSRGTVTR